MLAYDGRYDGPEYSHPFWPGIREPHICEVCGSDQQGRDRDGTVTLPHGSPHITGTGAFPLVVITAASTHHRAGELALCCPKCGSDRVTLSVVPGGPGSRTPAATWRDGDPIPGSEYAVCGTCQHRNP